MVLPELVPAITIESKQPQLHQAASRKDYFPNRSQKISAKAARVLCVS
jgi:hypothetical protein